MRWYSQRAERKKKILHQAKPGFQKWKRNKEFPRKIKIEGVPHHCTNSIRNSKERPSSWNKRTPDSNTKANGNIKLADKGKYTK